MDTSSAESQVPAARRADGAARPRLRGLFNTIPIMLAGSLALSMTGPIHPVENRRAEKPKPNPSELAKSIRGAFGSAGRTSTTAQVISKGTVSVAAAPANYTVVAGDTVSSIAGKYGLATASVLALNGLGWRSIIFAGQKLTLSTSGAARIVPAVTSPSRSTPSNRYSIQKGDTIAGIAGRFGLSTQTLLSANGLGWSSIIYPGQTLAIPGATVVASVAPIAAQPIAAQPTAAQPTAAQPTASKGYVIAKGDTIAAIASKFGVTSQAILTANGLTWSSIIYSGHTITIPGPVPSPAMVTTSSLSVVALTTSMAVNARTIVKVGRSLGVPDYGLVIALAAAAQESGLQNLDYGDRDSIGLFQQRPSTGWGSKAQLLNTTYAARLFFGGATNPNAATTKGLMDIAGWQSKSVTQAAQAVQLSAFPDAYAKWEKSARSWLPGLR